MFWHLPHPEFWRQNMMMKRTGQSALGAMVRMRARRRPAQRSISDGIGPVDLRSDTVTQPCAQMRSAMAKADVGDDVYGEDPTVIELEHRAAALLGKEDAVLLPSGTMANLACILSHTGRGDEVLLGRNSHIYNWEQGNVSSLASCIMTGIDTHRDGTFDPEDLRAAISYDDPHVPRTRLVCIENSHGGHAGTAVPACFADAVGALCAEHGLALHIDGARILNAAVALGAAPADLARAADTVTMCLSKGLGAPVGSLAAGNAAHMHRVRRWRKALGGGMRQAGAVSCNLAAHRAPISRSCSPRQRPRKLLFTIQPAAECSCDVMP
jgi:threonine aldolase